MPQIPEIYPSTSELARELIQEAKDAVLSDDGIRVGGGVLGAAAGFGIVRVIKGGEADQQVPAQNVLDTLANKNTIEVKPSHHGHSESSLQELGEAGIIGGMMTLGFLGGIMITHARQRLNNRATPQI